MATLDEHRENWADVSARTEFTGLLVGNGASLAVWEGFRYDSLYEIARDVNVVHRLEPADVALFGAFGTRNFEHVLAALTAARRVNVALGTGVGTLVERYASIQSALVEAVRSTHVPWHAVPAVVLQTIREALLNYEFVFSTNYDLLVYWSMMHEAQRGFKDFFWAEHFDLANTELWGKATAVLYLHGGLHLYRTLEGRTIKRQVGAGPNLLDAFGTEPQPGATPLFISEGSADDKMESIHRSDYLAFAYTTLAHHSGPLCIFGHSLGESDGHIVQAIRRARIRDLAVAMRPGTREQIIAAKADIVRKLPEPAITFFASETHPLGYPALRIDP